MGKTWQAASVPGNVCTASSRQKSPITSTSVQRKQVKGVGGDHGWSKEAEEAEREDAYIKRQEEIKESQVTTWKERGVWGERAKTGNEVMEQKIMVC